MSVRHFPNQISGDVAQTAAHRNWTMASVFNHNRHVSMKNQFITLIATILLVGAATMGVNISIIGAIAEANDARFAQIDARFEQVDARFEQVDRRLDRLDARMDAMDRRMDAMDRRIDERFRDMAAAIARLEGLIQGIHGQTTAGRLRPRAEHKA